MSTSGSCAPAISEAWLDDRTPDVEVVSATSGASTMELELGGTTAQSPAVPSGITGENQQWQQTRSSVAKNALPESPFINPSRLQANVLFIQI